MDGFSWALGTFMLVVLVVAMIITGFGWGKESLRSDYHQCIMLEAPQQNCIDKFLGKRK